MLDTAVHNKISNISAPPGSLPEKMLAVQIERAGGSNLLRQVERPLPVLEPGQVLIKVHAAGINRPDVLQRKGLYAPPPGVTDIPGLEVAGEIVDAGDTQLQRGDLVCALVSGGGYAQYCAAPAVQCLPIPRGLNMVEAASLPETFFTVWSNVFDRAKLGSVHGQDEMLLVHGGTSGIGTTAIQLATALGYGVIATAGTDDKCQACENLGAKFGINYKVAFGGWQSVVKTITRGRGVDVILDMIGGSYWDKNIECLADDGRIVVIATMGGSTGTVDLAQMMRRRLTFTGSTLRPRPETFKAAIATALREHVWPLIESGKIKPQVFATFALSEAGMAHSLMESSGHIGKIVLDLSSEASFL